MFATIVPEVSVPQNSYISVLKGYLYSQEGAIEPLMSHNCNSIDYYCFIMRLYPPLNSRAPYHVLNTIDFFLSSKKDRNLIMEEIV